MKPGTVIDAIERFFLDIIGSVMPGACLFVGLWIVFRQYNFPSVSIPPDNASDWVIFIGASYLLGHVIAGLERFTIRLFGFAKTVPVLGRALPHNFESNESLLTRISRSRDLIAFADLLGPHFPWLHQRESSMVYPARNLAISLAPAGEARVFRFMFLSLLTFGTTSALLLTLLAWVGFDLVFRVGLLDDPIVYPLDWIWFSAWILAAVVLGERGYTFRSIALRVPFAMATIATLQGALEKAEKAKPTVAEGSHPRLYLAGGFHSSWQDRVSQVWKGAVADPRDHALRDEEHYTFWDLEALRTCDWMLAYLEASNPGGYALSLEIGFARALGKRVILVDEKSTDDDRLRRYLGMIHACADLTFDNLEEALEFLKSFEPLRYAEGTDEVQRP